MRVPVPSRDKEKKRGVAHQRFSSSKKAPMSKTKVKSLLIYVFDSKGVSHGIFTANQTLNGQFYSEVLE